MEVSADPSLPTKLFVDVRNVVTAPQTAAYRIRQAFVPKVVNDVRGSAAVQSDEQAPSTQTALNAATNERSFRSVKGSADEPAAEAPKTTRLAKKTEKPNGARNLRRGNKFHPGDAAATSDDTTGSGKGESRKADNDASDGTDKKAA